jgi:hypothetical protein
MRKLIAWVFMYSLDGLVADEGTDYWQYCFGLPIDPEDQKQKLGAYESAYAHIMGRTAPGRAACSRARSCAPRRDVIRRLQSDRGSCSRKTFTTEPSASIPPPPIRAAMRVTRWRGAHRLLVKDLRAEPTDDRRRGRRLHHGARLHGRATRRPAQSSAPPQVGVAAPGAPAGCRPRRGEGGWMPHPTRDHLRGGSHGRLRGVR